MDISDFGIKADEAAANEVFRKSLFFIFYAFIIF
tara:strand:- start:174 stop:275 length:102 start_codon:yes stop_codon:yes gene_type:complete